MMRSLDKQKHLEPHYAETLRQLVTVLPGGSKHNSDDASASFFSLADTNSIPKSLTPLAKLQSLDNSMLQAGHSPIDLHKYSSEQIVESPPPKGAHYKNPAPTNQFSRRQNSQSKSKSNLNDSRISGSSATNLQKKRKSSSKPLQQRMLPVDILAVSNLPEDSGIMRETKSRIIKDIMERKKRSPDRNKERTLLATEGGTISSMRSKADGALVAGDNLAKTRSQNYNKRKAQHQPEVIDESFTSNSQLREIRSQSPYETNRDAAGLYKKVKQDLRKNSLRQSSSSTNLKVREQRTDRAFLKNKKVLHKNFKEQAYHNRLKEQNQSAPLSFGQSRSQSAHRTIFSAKKSSPTQEASKFKKKMQNLINDKADTMLLDPREGYPRNKEQYEMLSSEEMGNLSTQIYKDKPLDVIQKFHNQSLSQLEVANTSIEKNKSRKSKLPLARKVKIDQQKPFGVDRSTYQNVNTSLLSRGSTRPKKVVEKQQEQNESLPNIVPEEEVLAASKPQRQKATLLQTRTANIGNRKNGQMRPASRQQIQIPQEKQTKPQYSPKGVKIVSLSKEETPMYDSEYDLLRKESSRVVIPQRLSSFRAE